MIQRILISLAVICSACTPTYTMMDGMELRSFWDMSHELYHAYPLRIIMPEGQYVFVDSVEISYRGVECFVSGRARRNGAQEANTVRLPMFEAQRVWMDMHLLLVFKDEEEIEYAPGFWYFAMQRGVPLYLIGREIDADAEAKDAIGEVRYRFNDFARLGWRTGFYSPLMDLAVHEARKGLGLSVEEDGD